MPVSGVALAKQVNVSRQVVVQDIALLRANGVNILSTNKGYLIQEKKEVSRVFKVRHTDEDAETELNIFVDLGGYVKDVFVYHKVYDIVRADMNVKSRADAKEYLKKMTTGRSTLLKIITSGYHNHPVIAEGERILDMIQEELWEKGFLAKLQDHEPVNF